MTNTRAKAKAHHPTLRIIHEDELASVLQTFHPSDTVRMICDGLAERMNT